MQVIKKIIDAFDNIKLHFKVIDHNTVLDVCIDRNLVVLISRYYSSKFLTGHDWRCVITEPIFSEYIFFLFSHVHVLKALEIFCDCVCDVHLHRTVQNKTQKPKDINTYLYLQWQIKSSVFSALLSSDTFSDRD